MMHAFSKYNFDVPDSKKIRLIINTDAKNEADDQFAIVHALLTPKFCIKGIIAAHFGTRRTQQSMQESYEEVLKVLSLMNLQNKMDVYRGAAKALKDEFTPQMSEGAEMILREAMTDDPRPLYAIFLGPYDLSQSLATPGDIKNPKVIEAMEMAVEMGKKRSIAIATFVHAAEDAKFWHDKGVRLFSVGTDIITFYHATRDLRDSLKIVK